MTYQQATNKSIQEAFEAFHEKNPQVFDMIVEQVRKAVERGKKRLSIKPIIEWLRWETFLKTDDDAAQGRRFKINDAYTSRYARLLIQRFPDYAPLIEIRDLRA